MLAERWEKPTSDAAAYRAIRRARRLCRAETPTTNSVGPYNVPYGPPKSKSFSYRDIMTNTAPVVPTKVEVSEVLCPSPVDSAGNACEFLTEGDFNRSAKVVGESPLLDDQGNNNYALGRITFQPNAEEASDQLFVRDDLSFVEGLASLASQSPRSEFYGGCEDGFLPRTLRPTPLFASDTLDIVDGEPWFEDDTPDPAFLDAATPAHVWEPAPDCDEGAVAVAAQQAVDVLVDFVQRHPELRGQVWSRLRGGFEGCF